MSEFEKLSPQDREWLAFRYIAGELADDEAAEFEAELENSQDAREAVARSVDLSQTIAMAESEGLDLVRPVRETRKSVTWTYVGWISAGAIAASVVGAIWWNVPGQKPGTSELAEIWVERGAADPLATAADDSTESVQVLNAADPEVAPSWMTAGVISLSGGKVKEDTDGDGKPDDSWDDEVMEN